jgi:hypothetical protein
MIAATRPHRHGAAPPKSAAEELLRRVLIDRARLRCFLQETG